MDHARNLKLLEERNLHFNQILRSLLSVKNFCDLGQKDENKASVGSRFSTASVFVLTFHVSIKKLTLKWMKSVKKTVILCLCSAVF